MKKWESLAVSFVQNREISCFPIPGWKRKGASTNWSDIESTSLSITERARLRGKV